MPEPDFSIKHGDTLSAISATLEDQSGVPVDIQNANIRFKMKPISGGAIAIDSAATNAQTGAGGTSNPTTGQVVYSWGTYAGTASLYLAEWEVTFSGGSVQTFPNDGYMLVNVMGDLT
jgi:hypothetical protein